MTGFRLAAGGVQELENITPDLTCLGKIIGGGLPVGAFGGRAEVMDQLAPLGPVYHAGTLSGNPLAMAAGIASLQMLAELKPYARLDALGRQVCTAASAAAKAKGIALQAPQVGSMFSLFFTPTPVRDLPVRSPRTPNYSLDFSRIAWTKGSIFRPALMNHGF